MEKRLNELVERLKAAAGPNLKSVVLYGSAAAGEFHPKYSDLNVLCVLERLNALELARLNRTAAWWARKGHPAPLVLSAEELRQLADVFAIELLDMKAAHRVLFGEDVFTTLTVPMGLHNAQVERELRTNAIRLRQRFLSRRPDRRALLELMTASVSTFVTLFRHALMTLGEQPPQRKRDVFTRLATLLNFDAGAFHAVLDVREGGRSKGDLDLEQTFRAYLDGVTRVAEEVDRRLATLGH